MAEDNACWLPEHPIVLLATHCCHLVSMPAVIILERKKRFDKAANIIIIIITIPVCCSYHCNYYHHDFGSCKSHYMPPTQVSSPRIPFKSIRKPCRAHDNRQWFCWPAFEAVLHVHYCPPVLTTNPSLPLEHMVAGGLIIVEGRIEASCMRSTCLDNATVSCSYRVRLLVGVVFVRLTELLFGVYDCTGEIVGWPRGKWQGRWSMRPRHTITTC